MAFIRVLSSATLALGLSLASVTAQESCTDELAVWSSERDGVQNLIYGTEGMRYFSEVTFEEWRQSELAWRGRGRISCSNGQATCYVAVENNVKPADEEPGYTDVVIEKIDENEDGLSEWIIMAGLYQAIYYGGGARVEWFNGFTPEEYERVQMPSIYKFLRCDEENRPDEPGLPMP